MDTFAFDNHLIGSYSEFSRSFTEIRAKDLKNSISNYFDAGTFWPDALLSINPYYCTGKTVDELVNDDIIDESTSKIFRIGGNPVRLFQHQEQSIEKAKENKSFVVTTGTGSGKSLCFFIPIVDSIIRKRKKNRKGGTKAIIIYPMNALANSQIKEIEKYISQSGIPDELKPTVKRYTGQESVSERDQISKSPPDILLTNYMMAELLLTRQGDTDSKVIENASGLDFIVLDELHTYRGRQGADVAILVRRLRNRCCPKNEPIFIGTSATIASEGTDEDRKETISKVASKLFGSTIDSESIISESLRRATNEELLLENVIPELHEILSNDFPDSLTNDKLISHPLSVWIELKFGLETKSEIRRKQPTNLMEIVNTLSKDSGLELSKCKKKLIEFLKIANLPDSERGGVNSESFLAFKLHRFISGAGELYTTLKDQPRHILFTGELEDPNDPGSRLYPTRFCRECGQDFQIVSKIEDEEGTRFVPHNIEDILPKDYDLNQIGYLTTSKEIDSDYVFTGEIETFPEDWREFRNGSERLRSNRKSQKPTLMQINPDGWENSNGKEFWFIPGKFGFCPCCLHQPTPTVRERNKLAGLSGEGRSSATTLLVSSALDWMNKDESGLTENKRKILGFSDNRQDAALQAGHFNDFMFVSLLRGAILRAVLNAGEEGLQDSAFGLQVAKALNFTVENSETHEFWLAGASSENVFKKEAQRALAKVLGHRVWNDLRRGWRFTNPNLLTLNLVTVKFSGLEKVLENSENLNDVHDLFAELDIDKRILVVEILFKSMVEGLAVDTESLELSQLDVIGQTSRRLLRTPWSLDKNENIGSQTTLFLRAPEKRSTSLREEKTILRAGINSRLGRNINKKSIIGAKLNREDYNNFMSSIMKLLNKTGFVSQSNYGQDSIGWKLSPYAISLVPGIATIENTSKINLYFHNLYKSISDSLEMGYSIFCKYESREHTAQVSQKSREWREWRFRFEHDDILNLQTGDSEYNLTGESDQFLPALFCSPTMELGIDISELNAVYLRNVPPTPANYAQRAGRAGRSGQASLIISYCAAQSPHDQYYFEKRQEMVSGIVKPPTLDITNEELVKSHMHAVWLAESGLALSPKIPEILDLDDDNYSIKEDIRDVIKESSLVRRSSVKMKNILEQILLSVDSPPKWLTKPEELIDNLSRNAPNEFDLAFDRWRDLYVSAQRQLQDANARSELRGIPGKQRKKIIAAQAQASEQIALLEKGENSQSSDFYSYRYLATEGFLPGYNFPRQPIYAFIPDEKSKGTYLPRARFLAISEFGPRSLIYHEGRAYRIIRAKIPPNSRMSDNNGLSTGDIHICISCGACHDSEVERCHACNSSMADEISIKKTLRIDNVEAAPTERITANDEERIKQGFDIQTVFSWPRKNGKVQVTEVKFNVNGSEILTLQYANSADISRINKGLKRRKNQNVFGFNIEPSSGYWSTENAEDSESEESPDVEYTTRIVPIVRDRKNAILFRFSDPHMYEESTLTTFQHALMRGLEIVFQLEVGEILSDPLPARDNRRAILAYEATEGGAGVLSQLVEDPSILPKVAEVALKLMHFENVNKAISSNNVKLLTDKKNSCVRGCYHCLFSYYNQQDHELIYRNSEEAKQLLINLACGKLQPINAIRNKTDDSWIKKFEDADIPEPDFDPITIGEQEFSYVWRTHLIAASTTKIQENSEKDAATRGWTLIELPDDPASDVPSEFHVMFKEEI